MILKCVFLLAAGLFSGIMASIVGMASLILYPAMLIAGLSPIMANVTNTLGIIFSGTSSVLSSRRELHGQKKNLLMVLPFAVFGAIIGSLILINSSNKSFQDVAPIIIFFSGILMLIPKSQQAYQRQGHSLIAKLFWSVILILIGVYGGYFGAGCGVLMAAVLIRIIDEPYAEINAIRNFGALLMNLAAAIIFVFTMPIDWLALMASGSGLLIGGYIGPMIVRRVPSKLMRNLVGIGALILAVVLGIQAY